MYNIFIPQEVVDELISRLESENDQLEKKKEEEAQSCASTNQPPDSLSLSPSSAAETVGSYPPPTYHRLVGLLTYVLLHT